MRGRAPVTRLPNRMLEVLLCALCACAPADRAQRAAAEAPAKREMWGWSTQVTDRGRARARVQAGHFQQATEDEPAQFSEGVRVAFFDSDGDTVSILHAERGEINAAGDDMKVFGSVLVMARDSTSLQTDSLRWQREEDRITGDGPVTIFRPDGVETGVGFNAASDLKQWTLNFVQTQIRRKNP